MLRLLLWLAIATSAGCASSSYPTWTVEETARPDGTYGDWVTKEVNDDFGSYSFSIAKGESSNKEFGAGEPRVVVQDDFLIRLYVGDGYICADNVLVADVIWYQGETAKLRETLRMQLPADGAKDHFQWTTRYSSLSSLGRFMFQLAKYDLLALRYTDTCGDQRTLRYAISGSHHNDTREIAPE